MRVFWEQTGFLLSIYRLAANGTSDAEIYEKLNITEASVQRCMTWLLLFLETVHAESIDSACCWFPNVTLIATYSPSICAKSNSLEGFSVSAKAASLRIGLQRFRHGLSHDHKAAQSCRWQRPTNATWAQPLSCVALTTSRLSGPKMNAVPIKLS